MGKVTLKINSDEALSDGFLLKNNGDEALNDDSLLKSNDEKCYMMSKKLSQ